MTRQDKVILFQMLREQRIREARRDLCAFTFWTLPTFEPAFFHRRYYDFLTRFANGEIRKAMIFVPPQHGKSEGSTRRLPAFLLGLNPDLKIAVVSYNAPKARKFNREIQRVIDCPEYHEVFPETNLNSTNVTTVAGSWLRNADEFEIVGRRGGVKTVGVGGPLTGDPVDVLIMDDIYKDAKTAWSPIVRESVRDWYDTVAETRLHNTSRQLVVFTRWHEDDLGGTLLKQQGEWSENNPDGWVVVKYEAIKTGEPSEWDNRHQGEALWPERHSIESLKSIQQRNPFVFQSLYQQNPQPAEGLMYENGFKTYAVLPSSPKWKRKNYTDTADTGADFLCSIDYVETDTGIYVIDLIYTQQPMEATEPMCAEMMDRDSIDVANIESNNGGRGFARNVERLLRQRGNTRTRISWFAQSANKQVRIFTASASVHNLVYFPEGWDLRWPKFAAAMRGYMKTGRNEHDDAPDAVTGMVEMFPSFKAKKNISKYF